MNPATTPPEAATAAPGINAVESLDDLAAQAAALDAPAEPQAQPGAAQAPTVDTLDRDWTDTLKMLRAIGTAAVLKVRGKARADQLRAIWSDDALRGIAEPAAEICRRHQLDLGQLMGRYAPYLALAAALGVPAFETYSLMTAPDPKPAATDGQQQPA